MDETPSGLSPGDRPQIAHQAPAGLQRARAKRRWACRHAAVETEAKARAYERPLRRLLAAVVGAELALFAAADASELSNFPDELLKETYVETVFGTEVSDPYRWIESPLRRAQAYRWAERASDHAYAQFVRIPGFRRLLRERTPTPAAVRDAIVGDRNAAFLTYNNQIFRVDLNGASGNEKRILSTSGVPTISPAATRIAVTETTDGEIGWIDVYDAVTPALLSRRIGPIWARFAPAWIDDETILYAELPDPKNPWTVDWRLKRHKIGEESGAGLVIFTAGVEYMKQGELIRAFSSPVSDYFVVAGAGPRSEVSVYVGSKRALADGRRTLTKIAGVEDQIYGFVARGDQGFAISLKDNPFGDVLRLDLSKGETALAEAIILRRGEEKAVFSTSMHSDLPVVAASEGIYVQALSGAYNKLLYFRNGSGSGEEIDLPFEGSIVGLRPATDGDGAFFGVESWLQPTRWFRASKRTISPLPIWFNDARATEDISVISENAVSEGGVQVPMTILHRGDRTGDRPRPAIVRAYASYGLPTNEAAFNPETFAWLNEGGLYAYCGARGGGELGRGWHEDGRQNRKPNGHADVVACARRLQELGYAAPESTALHTYSAGGLLSPAPLRTHGVFAAVAYEVGMLNATRMKISYEELGDPSNEAQYPIVAAQDGVLALQTASRSPDTLVLVGLDDQRVPPFASLKFLATGIDRFGDDSLFMLHAGRTNHASGHKNKLVYAFFLNRFGHGDFARLDETP